MRQSPELAAVVVAAGGVPSLDVLRKHKAEVALEAALGLLVRLLALEEARSELVAQGERGRASPGKSAPGVWVNLHQLIRVPVCAMQFVQQACTTSWRPPDHFAALAHKTTRQLNCVVL